MFEYLRKIAVCALIFLFYKNGTPNQSADVFRFFWRSCFYLVLFGQIRGILGKFGGNLGKYGAWSALIWKNAPDMKRNAVVFFWRSFFRQWGNLGKNPSHPQKFACSYTYGSVTLPVTSASCEKSFSKMTPVKPFPRNSMTSDRLSNTDLFWGERYELKNRFKWFRRWIWQSTW